MSTKCSQCKQGALGDYKGAIFKGMTGGKCIPAMISLTGEFRNESYGAVTSGQEFKYTVARRSALVRCYFNSSVPIRGSLASMSI